MVICLGDTPGGHKGYTCKKYYYYCDKKGSWYDEFRAKCKATCKKGKIYAYLNFWPILYKNYNSCISSILLRYNILIKFFRARL